MRYRWVFLGLFFGLFLQSVSYANLVEEVDKLTPEEASYVRQTLFGKQMAPLPDYFFRRLGFVFGATAHALDGQFSTASGTNIERANGWFYGLRYRVNSRLNVGIDSYKGGRNKIKETTTATFESTAFDYEHLHLAGDFLLYYERRFSLKLNGSWGQSSFDYLVHHFSESEGTTVYRPRQGTGYTWQVGLEAGYYLNPIWSFGLGVSYFNGNLDVVNNAAGRTTTDGGVDFTGSMIRLFTSFNI